jgi:hypothetical protein
MQEEDGLFLVRGLDLKSQRRERAANTRAITMYTNKSSIFKAAALRHLFNSQKLTKRHGGPWSTFGCCREAISKYLSKSASIGNLVSDTVRRKPVVAPTYINKKM